MKVRDLILLLSRCNPDVQIRIQISGENIDIYDVDKEGDEDGVYIIGDE